MKAAVLVNISVTSYGYDVLTAINERNRLDL